MTIGQELAAVELDGMKLVESVFGGGTASRGLRARERERRLAGLLVKVWSVKGGGGGLNAP